MSDVKEYIIIGKSKVKVEQEVVGELSESPLKTRTQVMGSNDMYDGSDIDIVQQPSELAEAMKILDDDAIDPVTGMSKIDLNTRLFPKQVGTVTTVDSLVAFRFLPPLCLEITKQLKRNLVSIMGKGRLEKVALAQGKNELDAGLDQTSWMGKVKQMFTGKKEGEI